MSDKKLTDNEIKKALECCCTAKCLECKYYGTGNADCVKTNMINSLDLINRIQAENERLLQKTQRPQDVDPMDFCGVLCDFAEGLFAKAKAEAYKEFADKIHTEIHQALESNYKARAERIEKLNVGETDEFISYCQGKIDALRGLDDFIDETYKETVGEDNAEANEKI